MKTSKISRTVFFILSLIAAFSLVIFSLNINVMAQDYNIYIEGATQALQAGVNVIEIVQPSLTNKSVATVSIKVTPTPEELYFRLKEADEWKSVDDISKAEIQITTNTFVYIRAVDASGLENTKSQYIECFDRQAPTFTTAFQSDSKVTITARDDLSGVKAIYINDDVIYSGDFYNTSDNGRLVTYVHQMGNAKSIVVQVEDETGNFSKSTTINAEKAGMNSSSSINTTEEAKGNIGNAKITIIPPNWTNTKDALVKIEVSGDKIETVQGKIGRDGSWFTIGETMDFKITTNSEVYVKAIDTEGKSTVTSAAIFCFDYNPPVVKAVQDGDMINITTTDDLSEVAYVYVNGKPYVPDAAGGGSVSVDGKKSFVIQAKDNAQNMSKPVTIAPDGISGGNAVDASDTSTGNSPTYIINIGDGQYTIEELLKLGMPIYIFPEADEETIRAILYSRGDEIYKDNTGIVLERHMIYQEAFDARGNQFWIDRKGNFVLFDKDGKPIQWDGDFQGCDWYDIDGNLIKWDKDGLQIGNNKEFAKSDMDTESDPNSDTNTTTKKKKKKSNLGDIALWSVLLVGGGIVGFLYFLKKKEKEKFNDDDMYETDIPAENEEFNDFDKFDDTYDNSTAEYSDY